MIIRDTIRIGARLLQVQEVEHLSTDCDRWGDYNARLGVVRLDAGMSDDKKEETLLHEVCEAVSEIFSLGLTENQVCTISAVFLAIARDNPGIFGAGEK